MNAAIFVFQFLPNFSGPFGLCHFIIYATQRRMTFGKMFEDNKLLYLSSKTFSRIPKANLYWSPI